jgi:hypothetical protein
MLLNLLWNLSKLSPLFKSTTQPFTGDNKKKWELLLLSEKLGLTGKYTKLSKSNY